MPGVQEQEALLQDMSSKASAATLREQELGSKVAALASEKSGFKEQVKALNATVADVRGQMEVQMTEKVRQCPLP